MRTIEKANYHVRVHPLTTAYGLPVGQEKKVCQEIVQAVRRHVDNVASVAIHYDRIGVCSFCGRLWVTAEDSTHNDGCCADDRYIKEQLG